MFEQRFQIYFFTTCLIFFDNLPNAFNVPFWHPSTSFLIPFKSFLVPPLFFNMPFSGFDVLANMLPNTLVVPYHPLLFELKKNSFNILWCPLFNALPSDLFLVTLISICILPSVLVVFQHLIFLKNQINNSHFTHLPTSLGILLYTFGILQQPSWCSPILGESFFTLASPTFPMMFTTLACPNIPLRKTNVIYHVTT